MRRFAIACLALLAALPGAAEPDTLLFHSGFEPDSATVPAKDPKHIEGTDKSVSPPNDWVKDLKDNPNIGNFNIQYQGGTPADRIARIVEDPTKPGNHVLHYWIKNANVPLPNGRKKGRIQANLYGNKGIYEMRQRVRLYLPKKDFEVLRQWPKQFGWMTLIEFWNEPGWVGSKYPFRISINIAKDAGAGKPFNLDIHGQDKPGGKKWKNVWHERNREFALPVGEWLTLEYLFVEGGKDTGRLMMTVERENGEKTTVFDIHDCTRHPNNPAPNGLTGWNPLKLYTSQPTIDWVREHGGELQVYWDDFEIAVNTKKPAAK